MTTVATHTLGRRAMNRVTRERFRRHCRPLPRLSGSQHAERYRVLSPEATANHGPWRNDMAPYLAPMMDAICDRTTQEVTIVAPSQSGKSELILNGMLYFIHQEPSPIIVVQPTVETGESFSKDRFAPMIRDCRVLRALIREVRSRDSANTILSKAYPGGQTDIVGANAPSGLAMRPKRVVFLDERDRHPASAGSEGDVKAIVRARTRSYRKRRKVVEVSSPTNEEESLIWPSYLEGTQEQVLLVCPLCCHAQVPAFERLKFQTNAEGQVVPASVFYACEACEGELPASQQGPIKRVLQLSPPKPAKKPHKRSFRVHGIMAAFHDWVEICQEFVTANGELDPSRRAHLLMAFFNTTLGELYKDTRTETAKSALLARAKRYDGGSGDEPVRFQVPREAGIITAGWDLQHDRGEAVIRAWGVGETSWLIERVVLRGDTSQPEWWAALDEFRQTRTWRHEGGASMQVRSMCIDAGDGTHSKAVYSYCAPRLGQHVFAIKGSSNPSAPMVPLKHTKVKPGRLYVIGVNAIMDRLYRRLGMVAPGPGFLHLNEYADEEYARQLLSMRRVLNEKTRKRTWQGTPGIPNEVADAEGYAYEALLLGPVPVSSLAAEVERVIADGARITAERTTPKPTEKAMPTAAAPRPTSRPTSWLPRKGGGWLG